MAESLLDAIRELETRDGVLAAQIDELVHLERAIAEVRAAALAVLRFRGELPDRRDRAARELETAEAEVDRRAEAVGAAEVELAAAKREDARAVAERAVATAETSLRTAEGRVQRAREALGALDAEAAANEAEAADTVARAVELAQRIGDAAPPALEAVEPWGARARAQVFAERTHAEAERQRVIEEATELGSAATGETLAGAGVGAVRARVEAAETRG